jgi:hypothetical protein
MGRRCTRVPGYAGDGGGLFRIRMMVVVAMPLIFWMRAMLRPAAAASRTASSRLPPSQCRSFFSAVLSGSSETSMQRTLLPSSLGPATGLSRFGDGSRSVPASNAALRGLQEAVFQHDRHEQLAVAVLVE